MSNFGNLLVAGLISGSIYAIFAACVAVWFRVSNVMNLAIGDFAAVGAIGAAQLVRAAGIPIGLSILITLTAVAGIAWVFDWGVLHFALDGGIGRGLAAMFFFTLGLSSIIEGIARHIFGTDTYAAPPLWPGAALNLGFSIHIQRAGVLVIALAIVVGLLLGAFLHYTLAGKAASACGESTVGAAIVGINTQTLRRRILVGTAVVAALFGIAQSPMTGFSYSSGPTISLLGVIAAGLSGFRRPWRALTIGLGMGVAQAFLGGYASTKFSDVLLYALVISVILFRPQALGLRSVAA